MVQRLLIENLGYISFQQLVTLHPTFHFSAPYKDKTYRNSTGFVHRLPLAKRIGRHGLRQLGTLRSGLGNQRGVFCDLRLHPLFNRQSLFGLWIGSRFGQRWMRPFRGRLKRARGGGQDLRPGSGRYQWTKTFFCSQTRGAHQVSSIRI